MKYLALLALMVAAQAAHGQLNEVPESQMVSRRQAPKVTRAEPTAMVVSKVPDGLTDGVRLVDKELGIACYLLASHLQCLPIPGWQPQEPGKAAK